MCEEKTKIECDEMRCDRSEIMKAHRLEEKARVTQHIPFFCEQQSLEEE